MNLNEACLLRFLSSHPASSVQTNTPDTQGSFTQKPVKTSNSNQYTAGYQPLQHDITNSSEFSASTTYTSTPSLNF